MANPTPSLPAAARHGIAPVNGVRIWYAEFGHGSPSSCYMAAWPMRITGATKSKHYKAATSSS
jgi:hypothetical protein